MNLQSVSPNAKMPTDTSIRPMPARRAERASEAVEILASRLIGDRNVSSASWPGIRPKDGVASACQCPGHPRFFLCNAVLRTWMPGTSPGHDEFVGLRHEYLCDTDIHH